MTKSQIARALAILAWTSSCAMIWLAWTYSVIDESTKDAADPAFEAAGIVGGTMCTTGCMGGLWFMGLVVAALVWALVRR